MKNAKRNALSDLTNSNRFSSSSVSSSATIESINNNQNNTSTNNRKNGLNALDVKPLSTVHRTKNQMKTQALPKPFTDRCKKMKPVVSNEQQDLEDFIKKMKAYFKEIDEFELEEEVESVDE